MNRPEDKIQAAIVKELRAQGYHVHSCPNEGAGGNVVKMGQLITMGLYPGVSDLEVWLDDTRTLYLEVKAPNGLQKPAQKRFQEKCNETTRLYRLAYSFEEAIEMVLTL